MHVVFPVLLDQFVRDQAALEHGEVGVEQDTGEKVKMMLAELSKKRIDIRQAATRW
jgi:hypothetical protein